MFRCHLYQFFLRSIPGKRGKDFLLRHHVDGCSFCQKKLASTEEVRALLWQPDEVENSEMLARSLGLEFQFNGKERVDAQAAPFSSLSARSRRILLTASAASALLLLILGGVFLFRPIFLERFKAESKSARDGTERFSITRLQIGGEPANPIIYRPFGSDHIFVWAQKHKNDETNKESP